MDNRSEIDAEHSHLARLSDLLGMQGHISPPTHHHVLLRQRRFHFLEWGTKGKPPLLFLHGGNQSARTWDATCLALAEHYHCIALDQRGHGESEWAYDGDYSPQSHADDIDALIGHLGWDRFVLVGMSMGGLNGLTFAARQPHQLAGMIAVDVGPFIAMSGGRKISEFVQGNKAHQSLEDFVTAAMKFNPRRKRDLLRHSLTHTVRQMADGSWTWKADRRFDMDYDQMSAYLKDLASAVTAINRPTLVVRGAQSDVMSSEQQSRFVDLLQDGTAAIVQGAGHSIQGDNPMVLVEVIEPFLKSVFTQRK
ncbi:alpha/beta hydrolase [Pyruvatibacter sp.]|uniref:alpha/beta fold hydrolase n=1 Tax=Pyruvatibacter sp. TaxID=1981328 RepID=UPI00326645DC